MLCELQTTQLHYCYLVRLHTCTVDCLSPCMRVDKDIEMH